MPENAVYLKEVYFTYDGINMVLSNINLTIKKGEKVAIMGENGAGKTTLIKHFNGLLKPVKGEVRILGYDTRRTPVSTLARHVGIVFQNPDHQLFAESVEDEIAFALRNFGFPEEVVRKRTEWALNVMDLTRYRKTSPFLLSGGERKRVAIASVLSYNPEIIIFDEPTTGQDYFQKQKIAQLLKLLSLQNKTVIVVTHDVEFAVENFEKIIVMARGRIIAEGTPEDIFNDMKVLKTARLLPPQVTECAIKLKRYLPRIRTQVTKVEDLFSEIIKYC